MLKIIRSSVPRIAKTVLTRNSVKNILPSIKLVYNSIQLRSFADDIHSDDSHHHGKDEPFLDKKIVTERIIEVVKNFEKVHKDKVSPTSRFKEDLDLDSLDAVEVVMAIEEEFNIEIPDSEADKILSIDDAVNYVSGHPMAK